jgi:hypothetical protein
VTDSFLPDVLPIRRIAKWLTDRFVNLPYRPDLAFEGAGVSVADDEENARTVVTISGGGGGGGTPYASTPAAVAAAGATGSSDDYARGDHVHAHGTQLGGTLHAVATGLAAGFMAAADKTKLDGVATGATNDTVAIAALAAVDAALDTRLDTIEAGGWVESRIDGETITPGSITTASVTTDELFTGSVEFTDGTFPARVHERSGSLSFAGASQPWTDLGSVIAQGASTATLYELTLQVDHGSLTGSETILPAMGHRVLHVVTWRNGSNVCAFAYATGETAAPWNVADVEFQLVNSSGDWKIQVRKDVATDQVGSANVRANARRLGTVPWTSDTTPTLELFGGGSSLDESGLRALADTVTATFAVNNQTISKCAGVTRASGDCVVSTTTSGKVHLNSAGQVDIDAASTCTIDAVTSCTITAPTINHVCTNFQVNGVSATDTVVGGSLMMRDVNGRARLFELFAEGLDDATSGSLDLGATYAASVKIGRSAGAVGFYGSAGTAKQTGVPVTAAGVHAALVSLGLISA